MDIAQKKREENIAEYILYIWQLEDLMRMLKFSGEAIFATLIAPRDADEGWKLAALKWYMDIARLLEKEGKTEGGHLDHTLHLVSDLNDTHLTLMEQPAGRRYRELFARLAPELPRLRQTLGRDDVSDIELAFRALYAAMLYRMRGATSGNVADEKRANEAKIADSAGAMTDGQVSSAGAMMGGEISSEGVVRGGEISSRDATKQSVSPAAWEDVIEIVSPVIAMLSDIYLRAERGEFDLYAAE